MPRPLCLILAALLLLGPPSSAARAGTLKGRVFAEVGFDPIPPKFTPPADEYCAVRVGQRKALLFDAERGLANCVVDFPKLREKQATKPLPPEPTPVLDNTGCEFEPHVLLVRKGQPFLLRNSDPFLHNVHANSLDGLYSRFNVGINQGQPDVTMVHKDEEPLLVRCDAGHTWMKSYIYVSRSRWVALTDEHGRFEIPDIPAGRHTLRVWHEIFGRCEFRVKIGEDGEVLEKNFVGWHRASPAFGMFDPGEAPPPRPESIMDGVPTMLTTAAKAAYFPTDTPRRAPSPARPPPVDPEPGSRFPPWVIALWALGVIAAAGILLGLRRQRLEAEASGSPGAGTTVPAAGGATGADAGETDEGPGDDRDA